MSKVSKSIFVLNNKESEILYDYIDLSFLQYINTYTTSFWCCFRETSESVFPFKEKDTFFKDELTKWINERSLSYLKQSNVHTNLHLNKIECVKSKDKITIKNSKNATVIFHFNDKENGYVTTHETLYSFLDYTSDDRKYIIVTYES